jgi:hypothetical protein
MPTVKVFFGLSTPPLLADAGNAEVKTASIVKAVIQRVLNRDCN